MTTKDLSVRSREGLTSHDLVSAYHGSSRPETSTGHNAHERPSSALGGLQPMQTTQTCAGVRHCWTRVPSAPGV
jgi:hypothetical protein